MKPEGQTPRTAGREKGEGGDAQPKPHALPCLLPPVAQAGVLWPVPARSPMNAQSSVWLGQEAETSPILQTPNRVESS